MRVLTFHRSSEESKTPTQKDIGRLGEELAVKFLRKKGYRIIERNFTCKRGEIDIIASEGECLVFVEVKTRTDTIYGEPFDKVDKRKQRHLRQLADIYLQRHHLPIPETSIRFDIISIVLNMENRQPKNIEHLTGVF